MTVWGADFGSHPFLILLLAMQILHFDNHLLVVVKPAGVLSQADKTGDLDLLTLGKAFIKKEFNKPGNVFLGLVHRLDRPVSGVMVFARTSKAADRLSKAFRERNVQKRYIAIVEGELVGTGRCVDWLVKEEGRVRVVDSSYPKAKRAELIWTAVESDKNQTLVEVELMTGRPHQIRVQLSNLGYPILGDFRYGANQTFDGRNLALHAYGLVFEHPVQREPLTFRVPPPNETWLGYFEESIRSVVRADQGLR